jgi:hypothetical protein
MFFVIDNFFKDPDKIRIAARKKYETAKNIKDNGRYPGIKILVDSVKGSATNYDPIDEYIKKCVTECVSKHTGEKVHLIESCYQFVDKSYVTGIPHDDSERKYTSIVYLNPNPPKNSGTELFDHLNNSYNNLLYLDEDQILPYKKNFLESKRKIIDKLLWRLVMKRFKNDLNYCTPIANKYNRHLIFDSKYVHRAQDYFGEGKDSRLCLVSFFH